MKLAQWLLCATVVVCTWVCDVKADAESARPATFKKASDSWKNEGLQPVKAPGLDLLFVR